MKMPITININLKDKEDITDKYNDEILATPLSNYIYEQCYGEDFNKAINMNITCDFKLSEEEKNNIKYMLKNNFTMLLLEDKAISKSELIKEMILFIIGAIFILISYFVNLEYIYLLSEIMSIFGWVAIWEVAYNILFIDNKRRINTKRTKQLSKANITFVEKNM